MSVGVLTFPLIKLEWVEVRCIFPYLAKQGLIVSRISWGVTLLRATMEHGCCLKSSSTSLVYLAIGIRGPKLDG